jgi:hypothetical protein
MKKHLKFICKLIKLIIRFIVINSKAFTIKCQEFLSSISCKFKQKHQLLLLKEWTNQKKFNILKHRDI